MTKRKTLWRIEGARLRKARLERGWTQKEFVERTGLDWSMLSRLEANKAGNTSVETLGTCCDAVGVSADWLCGKSRKRKRSS